MIFIEMLMAIFSTTLISLILLMILLTISILYPEHRVWPPPSKWSWQYIVIWSLTFISTGGIVIVALLDWDTFIIRHWMRYIVGGILFIPGMIFSLWGLATLGAHASSGLKHRLVREGPYKYSRNPQYLGIVIALLGVILITNSLLTTILCILTITAFLITPLAEEPWLREQYGEEYIEYCKKVPRYL